jgi:hypothetical protein
LGVVEGGNGIRDKGIWAIDWLAECHSLMQDLSVKEFNGKTRILLYNAC